VFAGVARDVPTEGDEDCGCDAAGLGSVVDKVAETLFGAEVTEKDAVKELALKGFCMLLASDLG
jgi:hypothetical protein